MVVSFLPIFSKKSSLLSPCHYHLSSLCLQNWLIFTPRRKYYFIISKWELLEKKRHKKPILWEEIALTPLSFFFLKKKKLYSLLHGCHTAVVLEEQANNFFLLCWWSQFYQTYLRHAKISTVWPIKGLKFIQKEYAAPKEYPKAIRDLVTLFECVNQVSNNHISFTKKKPIIIKIIVNNIVIVSSLSRGVNLKRNWRDSNSASQIGRSTIVILSSK